MRRWILPAATALAALAIGLPASAQAAPDPVRALKGQLRPQQGVRVDEVARTVTDSYAVRTRYHSGVQLSASGPVASYSDVEDASDAGSFGRKGTEPMQAVAVGSSVYTSGEAVSDLLPDDATWIRVRHGSTYPNLALSVASRQTINVFDPAALKVTLKGAKARAVPGGYAYRGEVTYKELYQASPRYYGKLFGGAPGGGKVSWRLWTDRGGLLTRLVSSESTRSGSSRSIDSRYSGWGERMFIAAPAGSEVVDWKDRRRSDPAFPQGGLDPSAAHSTPHLGIG